MYGVGLDYDSNQCECDTCGEVFELDPADGPMWPLVCPECVERSREFDNAPKTVEIPFETMEDMLRREGKL